MPDQTEGLWISSDPQPDGTYTLVLSIDGDVSRALTVDEAVRYGRAVFAVASMADYEAAVYRQLTDNGVPDDAVLPFVAELRAARPPIDDAATTPLRYIPGLNAKGDGFIRLELGGRPIGQLSAADARSHAAHVIAAIPNALLDAVYQSCLVTHAGLSDREARVAVDQLGAYREEGMS